MTAQAAQINTPDADAARLRREIAVVALVSVAIALIGLWPHLQFSALVGEFTFFKTGSNEDTYSLHSYGTRHVRVDRLLSGSIVHALLAATGGTYRGVLVGMDIVLPVIIFLSAYTLGAQMLRSVSGRILFALTLIFSVELFSLGTTVSPLNGILSIDTIRDAFGGWGNWLVPQIEATYLNIYRSPEPQVAYTPVFLMLALMVHVARDRHFAASARTIVAVIILQVLVATVHVSASYPTIALQLFLGLVLAIAGRRGAALLVAGPAAICLPILVFAVGRATGDAVGVLFASRLPILTVGVVASIALSLTIAIQLWRRQFRDPVLWFALAMAGMPAALMNQQLITGMMVSARDWERIISMPLLVTAFTLMWIEVVEPAIGSRWDGMRTATTSLASALIVMFAATTMCRSYDILLPQNRESLAIARALSAAGEPASAATLVMLERPRSAPLVSMRMTQRPRMLLDYTDVFLDPIEPLPVDGFKLSPLGENLMEFWRLMQTPAEQVERILRAEARNRGGYSSAFLFNMCQHWYPCTDGRQVRTDAITARIPAIVDLYKARVASPSPRYSGQRVVLVRMEEAEPAGEHFARTPVARGEAGGTQAFVYLPR